MIVMFLIALITGVLAYNYRGSLDEGKVFKTRTSIERIETILNLAVAQNPILIEDISHNWKKIIEDSPLVQNSRDLVVDGWGKEYRVESDHDGKITVKSEGYTEYLRKK